MGSGLLADFGCVEIVSTCSCEFVIKSNTQITTTKHVPNVCGYISYPYYLCLLLKASHVSIVPDRANNLNHKTFDLEEIKQVARTAAGVARLDNLVKVVSVCQCVCV